MLSTPKSRGELFLAASLRDGLEDNNIRQVETLLSTKDADPNVLIPTHGISPFHLVIGNESEEFAQSVCKLFLRHGGDPNVRSIDGMTPVHVAAAWGRVSVLELLLANGGDPLCLDDEGRSPFHYAFDGAYYDAVATLGKYCGMNQDEEEEEPKYKLTLDKIFVNKGNVVAEYVPSKHSQSNTIKSELTKDENNHDRYKEESETLSLKDESSSLCKTADKNSNSNWSNINNVTVRRYKKRQTPEKLCDINEQQPDIENEKILVGKIIRRLSNTLTSESSKMNNETKIITRDRKNSRLNEATVLIKKEQPNTLIPTVSKFNKVVSKLTPRDKLAVDTSIISKSPNCRISTINDKTPKSRLQNPRTARSQSVCRKKLTNSDKTPPLKPTKPSEGRIRSASSTPKQTRYTGRLYDSAKIPPKNLEKARITLLNNAKKVTPTPIARIRDENKKKKITEYSPDTEMRVSRNIDRKYVKKNIVMKLDDRMYDENPEINDERCTKIDKLTEEFAKLESKVVENENDEDNMNNMEKREIDSKKIFETKNDEDKIVSSWLESPGSSNPLSVCSHGPKREKTLNDESQDDEDEETKIFLEIEEACRKKCSTPPASVSRLEYDDCTGNEEKIVHSDYSSGESTSIYEFYEAHGEPMTMSSWSRSESFVSVDQEYTYEDEEEGVAFIERHLCVIPSSTCEDMNRAKEEASWIDRLDQLSLVTSDNSSRLSPSSSIIARSALNYDDRVLREKLTKLGDIPGPITKTTFNVYLKRLWRLERARKRKENSPQTESSIKSRISLANGKESKIDVNPDNRIAEYLFITDWTTRRQYYRNLEDQAFKEYSIANPKRKYRGGISKTSFCYILLDPRITRDLPRCDLRLTMEERWRIFLHGIFYIGKGKAARPAAHLYDAFGVWSKKQGIIGHDDSSRKIRRILDIWQSERGVVCLHVFSHTMTEEACSREAAMIETLGTLHLTNCLQGTYYGYATTMNKQEKCDLGKYLLYKSMEIFMHEGERQLFPRNVIM